MKKILWFCVIFLVLSAGFGFSQSGGITGSQQLRVVSAFGNDARDFSSNIRSSTLYQYADGTFQLQLFYNDGTPEEYMYFRNPRRGSTGFTEYDLTITSGTNRYSNLTGTIIPSGNYIGITVYQAGTSNTVLSLQLRQ